MDDTPRIPHLSVTHRLKAPGARAPVAPAPFTKPDAMRLDTCLREVVIEWRPDENRRACSGLPVFGDAERLRGVDAYRLLLEIATGLRSAVPGETNVFGQFRRAWRTFLEDGHPVHADGLQPVMRRLFADTKTVRRQWLEGVGGASYGSLVRRLVAPGKRDRVLFVGAGELTRSMLPLFDRYRVGLWNRRPPEALPAHIDRIFAPGQADQAAAWADHAILTTTPDPRNDRAWHARLNRARMQTVVHLGHGRPDWNLGVEWAANIAAFNLQDVFELQREQSDYRSKRLERARIACARLADLLGDTGTAELAAA